MVLSSPRPVESAPLERRSLAPPEPRAGEVLLRVRCCGVCHTDLHIVEGEMPPAKLPVVPGHQVVAVVERVGPGVTHPAPGARVGVAWLYASCGVCEACRRGEENLCAQIMFTGYHVDGGYAQYLVARADYVYPLPGSFDDAHAAPLLCAGIIGYRALRLSGVRTGERLGLFGFGASAHLAIQVARHWGCEVFVFTRGDAHRRLAKQLGARGWAGSRTAHRRNWTPRWYLRQQATWWSRRYADCAAVARRPSMPCTSIRCRRLTTTSCIGSVFCGA